MALTEEDCVAAFTGDVRTDLPEGCSPTLVVFDTLSRNFGPGDESRPADMNLAIAAADQFLALWGCAVLFVHHPGHMDKRRSHGGSNLPAALDTDYQVTKGEDDIIRLEAVKTKDGDPPAPCAFEVKVVELGLVDDDGEPLTSCVLKPTEYTPESEKKPQGGRQKVILDELTRLEDEGRRNLEAAGEDPEGARVTFKQWRDACYELGVSKTRFYANVGGFLEAGLIRREFEFVSCTQSRFSRFHWS